MMKVGETTSPARNGRGQTMIQVSVNGGFIQIDTYDTHGHETLEIRPREAMDIAVLLLDASKMYVKTKNRVPLINGDEDEVELPRPPSELELVRQAKEASALAHARTAVNGTPQLRNPSRIVRHFSPVAR